LLITIKKIIIISSHKEFSLICCIGKGRAGQGRAGQGRAGQGRARQGRARQAGKGKAQCFPVGMKAATFV